MAGKETVQFSDADKPRIELIYFVNMRWLESLLRQLRRSISTLSRRKFLSRGEGAYSGLVEKPSYAAKGHTKNRLLAAPCHGPQQLANALQAFAKLPATNKQRRGVDFPQIRRITR